MLLVGVVVSSTFVLTNRKCMVNNLVLKSGKKNRVNPIEVFVTLSSLIDFSNAIDFTETDIRIDAKRYRIGKPLCFIPLDAEDEDECFVKARYYMNFQPKPFAVDVMKKIVDDHRFSLCLLLPYFGFLSGAHYTKTKSWLRKQFGIEYFEKLVVTGSCDATDADVFILIQNNISSYSYRHNKLIISLGSNSFPNWKTVEAFLFLTPNIFESKMSGLRASYKYIW